MIDIAGFRKCDGIGRDVLVDRIKQLCDELHENRTESAWDSEVHARTVRDNAALNANVSAVQARCSELLEEVRALRRELGR